MNPFGNCLRQFPSPTNRDWYEPNEHSLKQEGLPWFYFISLPDQVVEKLREKYVSESEKLWGIKHWLNKE